jgi:glycosyltransferase involved in cell wall biosynthesis
MKILLLNQVFYPDVVATAQHLSDLAAELARRGHEVTVVSSRRAYEHPDTLFQGREQWRGVNIIRVFSTRFGKGAKWRRAVDFASFLAFCCARLLVLPRHDVVVALTTPPLISFIGAWRAKLWGAKFCYWVMDFNPDEAIAAGWLRADSFAAKFLERLSRSSLRRAGKIIALDRFMRDRIVAKNIAAEKVVVIPPWSQDGDVRFDAAGRDEFRTKHGLAGKFVVAYSGNHSPVHPLDTVMQAADILHGEEEIVFAFIGGGSEFARIKKWAEGNPRVLYLPYQPLNRLSGSLSSADAHLVVMGNAMLGLVHPCKIYNIIAVNAPVLYVGPTPSHITEIFQQFPDYPWLAAQHGEAAVLADHIRRLAAECKERRQDQPREWLMAFSKATLVPRLIAAIEADNTSGEW